jgi:hypothetical protein
MKIEESAAWRRTYLILRSCCVGCLDSQASDVGSIPIARSINPGSGPET